MSWACIWGPASLSLRTSVAHPVSLADLLERWASGDLDFIHFFPDGTRAFVRRRDGSYAGFNVSFVGTLTTANPTASGNTTLLTPTAGRLLRLKAFAMVNNGSSVVQAGLRFAAAGTIHFNGDLAADGGARIMNLVGAHVEGAVGEALFINLSAAGNLHVTTITEEV